MKNFTCLIGILVLCLFTNSSRAQCPSGCNPLSGGFFISYTPQCYGESYQVQFYGTYDYALDCYGGGGWYNHVFTAAFNTTYCATLYANCVSSSPTEECCVWDGNGNCIQTCTNCNTTYSTIQGSSLLTIGDPPVCVISVSATKTNASGFGYGCTPGSITVSASTSACNDWYATVERLADEFGPQGYAGGVDVSNPTIGGLLNGEYLITAYSNPSGCTATTTIVVGQNNCQMDVSTSVVNPFIAGCPTGEIKVSANTNNCQGFQSSLMTTDSVVINSFYSLAYGDTFTFSNLPPGNYLVKTTDYPYAFSSCTRWDAITITPAPCVSPWTISSTSASGYGCSDGSFTIRDTTTNCTYFSPVYLHQFNKQNYYNNLNLYNYLDKEYTYANLPPGWYFFTANATYTDYYGQVISCDIWDSIYIEPACILTSTYSTSPASVAGCYNGEIKVTATTNACYGYTADILSTTDSTTIFAQQAAASGIELTWNTIPPGNYLVRIRTNPFYDTFCEEIFPITIAGAPCLSPWVISSASASGYGCSDGSFTIRDTTTNCTNFTSVYMYQFNQLNYYTVLPLYQYIDKEYTYINLPPGWYFFNATATYTDYYGQVFSCDIWDSIYIEPACILTSTYSTSPASVAGCYNGEIKVTATTNACFGYTADILSTTDSTTIFAQQAAASGIELTWNTIPPGNYLVRIRTNPFYDTFCEEIFPITIAGAPCLSPWVISSASASGYGCSDGSFTIRDTTTNCTNFTSVYMYQFNQLNYYTVLPLYQYIDKEYTYINLPPGWYFFNATATYTDYYGQVISCDIWDSIYIEPACILTSTYSTSPASVAGCYNGEIKVTATTNACFGYTADILSTTDSTTIFAQQAAASGIELTWNTIPPGNYLVRIRTNPFYDTFCEEIFPITIAGAPCLSPWVISSASASGYGCSDGSFTIRDTTTNCTNFTSVYMYQFNQLNYYTVLPLYQYIDKEYTYINLPPGWYFFNATATYTDYYGQVISCDIWDSIFIEPACSIQSNFNVISGCGVSTIEATSFTNSCNGYLANLFDSTGALIISIYNSSGATTTFNNLTQGIYVLMITSEPQGCQTIDTIPVSVQSSTLFFADNDGDTFGNSNASALACSLPLGYVSDSTDCDDNNAGINPGANEIINSIDDNCNGLTDETTGITLQLKVYIEGYYLGNGIMSAVLDPNIFPNVCDSISVVLRESIAPYSPVYTVSSTIDINGNGLFNFPSSITNQTYFIEVLHRNSISTWSKYPVLFNLPVINYDFTN